MSNPFEGGENRLNVKPSEVLTTNNDFKDSFEFNFYRENSNHAYAKGEVIYSGSCSNNFILSTKESNLLQNANNLFIVALDNLLDIRPISDLTTSLNYIEGIFWDHNTQYSLPIRVEEREKVENYPEDSISGLLKEEWGLSLPEIKKINSGRLGSNSYLVKDLEGKLYVFKSLGQNRQQVLKNLRITSALSNFFPKNYQRKNNSLEYKLGSKYYGLEDFIGDTTKARNLDYFARLGKSIALFHNEVDSYHLSTKDNNTGVEFNESNLLAMYVDSLHSQNKTNIPNHLVKELILKQIPNRIRSLPVRLIHGDLNFSNVLDNGERHTFIDTETLGYDIRLKEFIPPLLLEGEMQNPFYVKGSLRSFINSYNVHVKDKISNDERELLPLLLQTYLLKKYFIKVIRRGHQLDLGHILQSINQIKEDKNVY